MQDMRPQGKRPSLRDLAEKAGKRKARKPVAGSDRNTRSRRRSSAGIWIGVVVILLVLFFALSVMFSGAKIVAHPQVEEVSVSGQYEARESAGAGELQYEMMTITKEGEESVSASGTEFVEQKASGLIKVFNSYGPDDQELIANTRFESPDGHIYRIREPIVVPGTRDVNGEKVPGSVTVKVYADEPGEEYNVASNTRFTIPGFAGGERFEAFYAQSETAMSGGFVGERSAVSEADKSSATNAIQTRLREELLQDAYSQKPEGFVMYDDGVFIDFEDLPVEEGEGGNALVRQKATLRGVIFNEEQFAGYLADNTLPNYDGGEVVIENADELNFALTNKGEVESGASSGLRFTLDGMAKFVWQFDQEELLNSFSGKRKKDIDYILSAYPGIESAEVIMRPFWRRSFPETTKDIKLEVVTDK